MSRWLRQPASVARKNDYAAAIAALNSLQTNAETIAQIRDQRKGKPSNELAIAQMLDWVKRAGYEAHDFNSLNVIHVAGTKGKGSTSAFMSSILAQYTIKSGGLTAGPSKVGLYTSPHLRYVRERIQIDNEPLPEPLFAKYFFEIWDRLSSSGEESKPVYFRYLTIAALHAFLKQGVDTAILECGIGGEYDSTNIIESPTVTAITALGIDHESVLGDTIDKIAWHKAGIFKPQATALTVDQPAEAMRVLQARAQEKNVVLNIVKPLAQIESGEIALGLAGDFQKSNASIAAVAAACQLQHMGIDGIPDLVQHSAAKLPEKFVRGLEATRWPGRCDKRDESATRTTWYLDGAHTLESIELATKWFAGQVGNLRQSRILIFNQQTRDANALARSLYATISPEITDSAFDMVIFTTNLTYNHSGYTPDLVSINTNAQQVQDLAVQQSLARTWRELDTKAEIEVCSNIDQAISIARTRTNIGGRDRPAHVFVTGSLHTVGGAIEVLEKSKIGL